MVAETAVVVRVAATVAVVMVEVVRVGEEMEVVALAGIGVALEGMEMVAMVQHLMAGLAVVLVAVSVVLAVLLCAAVETPT